MIAPAISVQSRRMARSVDERWSGMWRSPRMLRIRTSPRRDNERERRSFPRAAQFIVARAAPRRDWNSRRAGRLIHGEKHHGSRRSRMKSAAYRIVPFEDGWGVAHDGKTTGPYETKEAAFEAAVLPASNAIKLGYAVSNAAS